MKQEMVRYMWLFVFFDLPVKSPNQRKEANRFRKFLQSDGYLMMQFSIYTRVVRGEDAVDKHISRVLKNLPKKGHIRTLSVTERQYAKMKIIIGESTKNEKNASNQLVLL
jgi:CRISPR-associated protein Cas2